MKRLRPDAPLVIIFDAEVDRFSSVENILPPESVSNRYEMRRLN
jgi:hypothetical protein